MTGLFRGAPPGERQRLNTHTHTQAHWPAIASIEAHLNDGDTPPLMRLRYGGSAHRWGVALYLDNP